MDESILSVKYAEKARWMFLKMGEKAKASLKLRMPHQEKPLHVKKIEVLYPEFAQQIDGALADSVITFFWKYDKQSGIYEFIDADAKEEVAEMMGVENLTYTIKDEIAEENPNNRQLTEQEIKEFHEYLEDAREGLEKLGWRNPSS